MPIETKLIDVPKPTESNMEMPAHPIGVKLWNSDILPPIAVALAHETAEFLPSPPQLIERFKLAPLPKRPQMISRQAPP